MQSAVGLYISLPSPLEIFRGERRLLSGQTPYGGGRRLRSRCCAKSQLSGRGFFFSRRVLPRPREQRNLQTQKAAVCMPSFGSILKPPLPRHRPRCPRWALLCLRRPSPAEKRLKNVKGQKILLGPPPGVWDSGTPAHGHRAVPYARGRTRTPHGGVMLLLSITAACRAGLPWLTARCCWWPRVGEQSTWSTV